MKDQVSDLVTVAQAAKELGITRYAVYKAIEAGNLASVEVLGKIGVPRRALKKYQPNEMKIRAGHARAEKKKKRSSPEKA
jgi:excisionase family DNA binding protein